MKILALGVLGVAACWRGGGEPTPLSSRSSSPPGITVASPETDPIVGRSTRSENEIAREQAIEQARAAGILGSVNGGPATPPGPPSGPLDKAAIRREIHARTRPITLCYEQRLIEDASLQGTTKVSFTIGADGRVTSAVGSGFDPSVDACVADVIKHVVFPAPAGGKMQVNYPFIFRPAGG